MQAQTADYLFAPTPLIVPKADTGMDRDLKDFIERHGPTHFVRAHLLSNEDQSLLQLALNDWVIRVNRCYLGRRWHTSNLEAKVMRVFACLASGKDSDSIHAVMLVRPPATADLDAFPSRASQYFANEHLNRFPPLGDMEIDSVEGLAVVHDTLAMVIGLKTRPSTGQMVAVFNKLLSSL
jgi:hypothetical protein